MNFVSLDGEISGSPKSASTPDGRLLLVQFRIVQTGLIMDVVASEDVAASILPWLAAGERVAVHGALTVTLSTDRATGLQRSRSRVKASAVVRLHRDQGPPPHGGVAVEAESAFHLSSSTIF